jgi:hypothetical protein
MLTIIKLRRDNLQNTLLPPEAGICSGIQGTCAAASVQAAIQALPDRSTMATSFWFCGRGKPNF